MKYIKFTIKKFKGIDELELDLSKIPNGKIFPLVGLNEAGKTTILEAIDFFQNGIEEEKAHELIHKRDKGHFTGNIEVSVILKLDNEDKKYIKDFIEENNLQLESDIESIEITKKIKYENGKFKEKLDITWSFTPDLSVKTSKARNYQSLYDKNKDLWKELADKIEKKRLPKILYFEDFIFDFPEKIYLKVPNNIPLSQKDKEKQKIYSNIINDVLKTCNSNYSINDLFNKLNDINNTGSVESGEQILDELAGKIKERIIDPWNNILKGTSNKNIKIKYDRDQNNLYLQIRLVDGWASFNIDERSLGFRWFFSFILFVEFRKARSDENGEYLFLFDEPAKNLHENSQKKLLNIFDDLTNGAKIIYSTHSPYILKTDYLLNTFVVKDFGLDNDDEYSYKQNIKATSYKQFVASSDNEETHYKPLLDVLEFQAHDFEFTHPIVFFEGKNDYYTFKWVLENYFQDQNYNFKLYPGASVNKYENIFREYLAHNKNFIAIFDADNAGKTAKKDYIKKISQELENQIFTLKNIDNNFDNFTTERLFSDNEKLLIIQKSFPEETSYNKGKFNSAIQELFIKRESITLSDETKNKFMKVFDFIQGNLSNQN